MSEIDLITPDLTSDAEYVSAAWRSGVEAIIETGRRLIEIRARYDNDRGSGDVLYTKGGTTGIAAAIDFDTEIAVWVHVALLKTRHELVHPFWLEALLNSEFCYRQSQELTHGIANRDLGLTRMVKIRGYLPPLNLQNTFASRVSDIQAMIAQQERMAAASERLVQSLMAEAFEG